MCIQTPGRFVVADVVGGWVEQAFLLRDSAAISNSDVHATPKHGRTSDKAVRQQHTAGRGTVRGDATRVHGTCMRSALRYSFHRLAVEKSRSNHVAKDNSLDPE